MGRAIAAVAVLVWLAALAAAGPPPKDVLAAADKRYRLDGRLPSALGGRLKRLERRLAALEDASSCPRCPRQEDASSCRQEDASSGPGKQSPRRCRPLAGCNKSPSPLKAPYQRPANLACACSCLQLRDQGGAPQDGVYWFTGMKVPVLCDFSLDGGGWTLLVAAVSNEGWDALGVLGRAQRAPTLTDNYSILQHADAIRDLGTTGRFAYRIEAVAETGRQRWGGVWLAPRNYSFVSETPFQTNITLYRKFDPWQYKDTGIEQRMPWINTDDKLETLLTTTRITTPHWWGTLVAHKRHANSTVVVYKHSPWIDRKQQNSGNTLYWMREEEA